MKVAFLLAMWKRPILTRFTLSRFVDQARKCSDESLVVVAGSEGDTSKNLAIECGATYIEFNNRPLNKKFNAASSALRSFNPDFSFLVSTDTLFSDNYFKTILSKGVGDGAFHGVKDFYSFDYAHKRFGYWGGYKSFHKRHREPIGTGRCFNRETMERCGWELWEPEGAIDSGLDYDCRVRLGRLGVGFCSYDMNSLGVQVVEVKTDVNIWQWGHIIYDRVLQSVEANDKLYVDTGLDKLMDGEKIVCKCYT